MHWTNWDTFAVLVGLTLQWAWPLRGALRNLREFPHDGDRTFEHAVVAGWSVLALTTAAFAVVALA